MDPELYIAISTHSNVILNTIPTVLTENVTQFQNTILHVAVMSGNIECVGKILVFHHSLLHKKNMKGDTALHVAARLRDHAMMRRLTEALNPVESLTEMTNNEGNTVLHEAVLINNFDVVNYLINTVPSLANCENEKKESAFFMAVDRRFTRIANRIIETGSYSVGGRNGMNAIQAATTRIENGKGTQWLLLFCGIFFFDIPRFLSKVWDFSSWITMKVWDFSSWITMLVLHLVEWLFNLLLPYTMVSKDKSLVLIGKVWNISMERQNLQCADDLGWTALHYFAHIGNAELINQFLEAKENWKIAYARDNLGMSALHIAASAGRIDAVKALIEKCPDLCELVDNRKRTTLHIAAESKKEDIVRILMGTTAFNNFLNERDNDGNTALHLSASYKHYRIVDLFTGDKRVDLGAINNAGMTALDIAIRCTTQHDSLFEVSIIVLLKRRGGQVSLERVLIDSHKAYNENKTNEVVIRDNSILNPEEPSQTNSSSSRTTNGSNMTKTIEQIKNTAQVNLIVATIITSITFSAGIGMPGGYGSSDGMSNLRDKGTFTLFLIFDSVAFGCAASSMLIHFFIGFISRSNTQMYNWYPSDCIFILTIFSIASTGVAFFFGTNAVLWHDPSESPFPGYIAAICFMLPILYLWFKYGVQSTFQYYFSMISSYS